MSSSCTANVEWLQANHGRHLLSELTGQDMRALEAFAHLADLYAVADGPGREAAVLAMAHATRAMQPKVRHVCVAALGYWFDGADLRRLTDLLERAGRAVDALIAHAGVGA